MLPNTRSQGNKRLLLIYNNFLALEACLCLSKAANDNRSGPFIFSLKSIF